MISKSEIQFVRSLFDKKARQESGLFLAEGEKFISELLLSELNVRRIYALEGIFEFEESVVWVSPKEMERLSQLKSANSCVAVVEMPRSEIKANELKGELILALDGVQNPGNLGTIIRLADWFGIKHVVCSEGCADCFNSKVVQATMGAILRVQVHYVALPEFLEQIKQQGMPIYGTMLDGDSIYSRELSSEGVIVMGSEGQGLSSEVAAQVSDKLLIPSYPADEVGSESLNVAIAAAIVCAEFRRPR